MTGAGELDEFGVGDLLEEIVDTLGAHHIGQFAADQQEGNLQPDRGLLLVQSGRRSNGCDAQVSNHVCRRRYRVAYLGGRERYSRIGANILAGDGSGVVCAL